MPASSYRICWKFS